MTKFKTGLAALVISAGGLFAFKSFTATGITGKVTPADGATTVWAISGTDSVSAAVTSGSFNISVPKAGTYKVIVDAVDPYKDFVKENITVTDGQATDIGDVVLEK